MTGTSIDAIDAAVIRIHGTGLAIRVEFVGGHSESLGEIASPLRALAEQRPVSSKQIAELSLRFAAAHTSTIRGLLEKFARGATSDLIAVHGQTVYHNPPASWQMLNPWPIVHAFHTPVVFDLRGADIAAGGQGAPITPLADAVLFCSAVQSRAIVNLGGFCNVTLLSPKAGIDVWDGIHGFDVCACNLVLDEVARRALGRPFDENGRTALGGNVHATAHDALLERLKAQVTSGRSLGTGDEIVQWVAKWQASLTPADLAATACQAVGRTIGEQLRGIDGVYLAGGGARNRALVAAISKQCGKAAEPLDALGVPIEFREAVEMAVLGALSADGVSITLPTVTGVPRPAPLAGCWAYPSGSNHIGNPSLLPYVP